MVFRKFRLVYSNRHHFRCGMTFPCLWCSKRFVRSHSADHDSIDFVVYKERSDPEVEEEIRKFKFAPPKATIIPIDRDYVIPPILHAKIKIGNELFSRLLEIADKSPNFQRLIKEKHLDVNRHAEGVIYSRFNGNDIKRFCAATEDFARKLKRVRLIDQFSGVRRRKLPTSDRCASSLQHLVSFGFVDRY